MTGVIDATGHAFKSHPYLWGGMLAGVVVLGYVFAKTGSSKTTGTSTFVGSIGPSDAAIAAGTNLQIAQIGANASSFQASTAAATSLAENKSMFDYMTGKNTVDAGVTLATLDANTSVAQSQIAATLTKGLSDNQTNYAIASNNNSTSVAIDASNNGLAWHTSDNSAATTEQAQALSAQVAMGQQGVDLSLGTQKIARQAAADGSVLLQNSLTADWTRQQVGAGVQNGMSQQSLQDLEDTASKLMMTVPRVNYG